MDIQILPSNESGRIGTLLMLAIAFVAGAVLVLWLNGDSGLNLNNAHNKVSELVEGGEQNSPINFTIDQDGIWLEQQKVELTGAIDRMENAPEGTPCNIQIDKSATSEDFRRLSDALKEFGCQKAQ